MTDHLLHYTPGWWLCTQTSTHSTLSTSSQGCVYTNIYTQYTQYLLTGMCTQTCMLYIQYLLTGMCTQICSTLCTSSQGYVHKHLCCTLGTSSQGRVHKLYKICVKHLHTIHSVPPHRDVYTNIYTQYTQYLRTGTCTQTSTHNTLGTSSQGCVHKHLHTIHLVPPHRDVHTNTNAVPPHAVHSVLPCRWGVHKHLHTVHSYLLTGRCVHTTHWEMCV